MLKPDDEWLRRALKDVGEQRNNDFFNQWATPTELPKIPYLFYFDDKYHWIVKHPNGQDQVVDPELWGKFIGEELLPRVDRNYYLDTTVADRFYGEMRLTVEIQWRDGMAQVVNLVAPDGDPIKSDIKKFHIGLDEAI